MKFYIFLILIFVLLFSFFPLFSFAKISFTFAQPVTHHSHFAIWLMCKRGLQWLLNKWQEFHQTIKTWWQNNVLLPSKTFFKEEVKKEEPILKERLQTQKKKIGVEIKKQIQGFWNRVKEAFDLVF